MLYMAQILLSDCIYFLRYYSSICIVIICFPVGNVINFEINLAFLASHFPTQPKRSGQKFKYYTLKTKRAFKLK